MALKQFAAPYRLVDSGNGRKLEQFGPFLIDRPAAAAVWRPALASVAWAEAHAVFSRQRGNRWSFRQSLPPDWCVAVDGLKFRVAPTPFGHLGVFPEHATTWRAVDRCVRHWLEGNPGQRPHVLNLFAYSGGATLAALRAGAAVCHLDASRPMVSRARENACLNNLGDGDVRWLIDDVRRFLKREIGRSRRYHGIVLDPPTYGRGTRQEVFKVEHDIGLLLDNCRTVLVEEPLFVLLTSHTPTFTPTVLRNLLTQSLPHRAGAAIDAGELAIAGQPGTYDLPSGSYAFWHG